MQATSKISNSLVLLIVPFHLSLPYNSLLSSCRFSIFSIQNFYLKK
nr:MAG TPA: hypothetical protein [Caudoviricetes sp.]